MNTDFGSIAVGSMPWLGLREPNYTEIKKVTGVSAVMGIRIVGHKDVPECECHVVQNGRRVLTIKHGGDYVALHFVRAARRRLWRGA